MRLLDFPRSAREVAPGTSGRFLIGHITRPESNRPGCRIAAHPTARTVDHDAKRLVRARRSRRPHLLGPGQMVYIAPHERHSARALTASVVLDVFHPPRDDYR